MRGKRISELSQELGMRIIPAHAGQTTESASGVPARPDHPRACGANAYGVLSEQQEIGSSPRMRGKRGRQYGGRSLRRIIPAHAGQTAVNFMASQ